MANPLPLTSVDGRVLAYACGQCGHVGGGVWSMCLDDEIDATRRDAERCCTCRECGILFTERSFATRCRTCEEAYDAKLRAYADERRPEMERRSKLIESALAQAHDRDAALRLRDVMSDISEAYYCAGWLIGLEHTLWGMLHGQSRTFGIGEVEEQELAEVRRLHEKAGGWFAWSDDAGQAIFMPTAQWEREHA